MLLCAAGRAGAQVRLSDEDILGRPKKFHIESSRLRFTYFDQDGRGYQSQADRASPLTPGSERTIVAQPQLEVIAHQGTKYTHRLWVPLDVISAASPDAIDAISTASAINEGATFDLSTTYHRDRRTDGAVRVAFRVEEPFRSWQLGGAFRRAFLEDNTVLEASLNQTFDWLDKFTIQGWRNGRGYRSSTNGNLGVTQLLSPYTIANLNYGVTVQLGELSNTWNAVPSIDGKLIQELLPELRHRHAFVARVAQALPWRAALKAMYRFYVDNWGILAHTVEVRLYQRVGPWFYVRATYRFHQQNAPDFWTTAADPMARHRSADSDLASLNAQTLGLLASFDLRLSRHVKELHADLGYERYFRSNGMNVDMYLCSVGLRY
jgi:hypothetical protein